LIGQLSYHDTVSEATVYVNIATCLHAFSDYQSALSYFERARAIYDRRSDVSAELKSGLLNNMGLTLAALGRHAEAQKAYQDALSTLRFVSASNPEQAITWLNMADDFALREEPESSEKKIFECLDRAEALLEQPGDVEPGYLAYVFEHCAPTFEYFGYFDTAARLRKKAEDLYERP